MKKQKLKITMILSAFTMVFLIIIGVFIFSNPKTEKKYKIDRTEAIALEIENTKITNISNVANKKNVTTKIKNKLDYTVSNININYTESDKDQNKISTNEIPVEVSLKKDEKAVISIVPQNYTDTIDIVGYNYRTEDYDVNVDLQKNEVAINELEKNDEEIVEDAEYAILEFSELEKKDDVIYKVWIKNLSKKNLGNIILKVAEVNEDKEYVSVNYVSYNSTLKAGESTNLLLESSNKENSLEIVGYTYDDIENKSNVDVDLKSHYADIIRN